MAGRYSSRLRGDEFGHWGLGETLTNYIDVVYVTGATGEDRTGRRATSSCFPADSIDGPDKRVPQGGQRRQYCA